MIERIATLTVPIQLGHAGENEILRVGFDLTPFSSAFPGGHPTLLVQRPCETEPYPVELAVEDNTAWWTVTSTDTAIIGYGFCQLHWYLGDQLAKSTPYQTLVTLSLANPANPPPAPAKEWYEQFIKTLGELESLKTEDKSSIVGAVNELFEMLSNWTIPVAGEETLGGIKTSDSITVDEDGCAHAVASELSEKIFATDAEVESMLNEIFGEASH